MTRGYFKIAARFLGLALIVASGGLTQTAQAAKADSGTTQVAAPSFEKQAMALIATYPDGGPALEKALADLVDMQGDGAATVAGLMAAMGETPSPGVVIAVNLALRHAKPYTDEALMNAVAIAVSAAPDPVAAARGVMIASVSLPDTGQSAVGRGLAQAASTLDSAGRTNEATLIVAEVQSSKESPLKASFGAEAGSSNETGSTENQSSSTNTTIQNANDSTPENPASAN